MAGESPKGLPPAIQIQSGNVLPVSDVSVNSISSIKNFFLQQ